MKFILVLLLVSGVTVELAAATSLAQNLCLVGLKLLNGLSDLGGRALSQQIAKTCGQQWWSIKLGPVCKIVLTDTLGKDITASFGQCSCGSGNTCQANPVYCSGPTALNGLCKLQSSHALSLCADMTIYTCTSTTTTSTSTTTTTTSTTTTQPPTDTTSTTTTQPPTDTTTPDSGGF